MDFVKIVRLFFVLLTRLAHSQVPALYQPPYRSQEKVDIYYSLALRHKSTFLTCGKESGWFPRQAVSDAGSACCLTISW